MPINQISTANTFQQWLIATQSLIAFANSLTNSAIGTSFTSNTQEFIITGNLVLGNSLTSVTVNTDIIVFDDGTTLTSNNKIVNSYLHANGAFDKANGAYTKANSATSFAQQVYDYANTISINRQISGNNLTVLYTVTGDSIVGNTNVITNLVLTTNIVSTNITSTLITTTDLNTTSDAALKENMVRITDSLDVLEQITGLSFNWKSDGIKSYGVSAQEIEKVLPEIVRTRNDGHKGVNYLNLIAFLIEAIKELKKDVSKIKNHINIK